MSNGLEKKTHCGCAQGPAHPGRAPGVRRKGLRSDLRRGDRERAKVSKPIVYEHFGGKEGLYAVVVDREMEYVIGVISEALSAGSPRERAEQAALAFLTWVKDNPDGFAVLTHDAPGDGVRLRGLLEPAQ